MVHFLVITSITYVVSQGHCPENGLMGAGTLVLVGEDVDRTLRKNQHILNIVPTTSQHPPHPHILSTRIPRT